MDLQRDAMTDADIAVKGIDEDPASGSEDLRPSPDACLKTPAVFACCLRTAFRDPGARARPTWDIEEIHGAHGSGEARIRWALGSDDASVRAFLEGADGREEAR